MDARQTGSLVSLTISRLSTSSAVRRVASACVRVWRRVAASAWAEMMSIGASVPTSTRTRLSSISFSASESDCLAASMARIAASRSQYAFLVVAVRFVMRVRSVMSVTCRVMAPAISWLRVVSILKSRSSGWLIVAVSCVVNCGFNVAKVLVVLVRELLNAAV